MSGYEIYNLKYRWSHGRSKSELRERLLASKDELDEGIAIPVFADLLDIVPALVDPSLDSGTKAAEIAAVNMATDIQKAIRIYGVWLSATRRVAVMRAEVGDE